MKTINNKFIWKALLFSSVAVTASVNATTVDELNDAIAAIENVNNIAGDESVKQAFNELPECSVKKVVFARGIQSYKYDGAEWLATGPLAELFDTDYLNKDSGEIFIGDEKIGTHYQHLAKPAWEFPEGRVIVDSVFKSNGIEGAGNVKWLNVGLVKGYVGKVKGKYKHGLKYDRLYRVLTDRGVAPVIGGGEVEGDTVGSGYTTFYVFLACDSD